MPEKKNGNSQNQNESLKWSGLPVHPFGPTTLHLKHEVALFLCLTFLTIANHATLYENALEWRLIYIQLGWLSRYLLLRLICTTDTFDFMGIKSIVCNFFVAGQYFDATTPSLDYTRPNLLPFQIPFLKKLFAQDFGSDNSSSRSGGGSKGGKKKDDHKLDKIIQQNAHHYIISKFNEIVPPGLISKQLCFTAIISLYLFYILFCNVSFHPYRRALLHGALANLGVEHHGAIQTLINSFEFDYNGATVSWYFSFLVAMSTLSSVFLFGRLMPPIPDLISGMCYYFLLDYVSIKFIPYLFVLLCPTDAGTNVIKAIRKEAKILGRVSSKSKKEADELPWAEQYRSIVVENRLRLNCHVILFRVIENLFMVGFLPVTELTCIVSGLCKPGPRLWDRYVHLLIDAIY